jgi:hypothetical protein
MVQAFLEFTNLEELNVTSEAGWENLLVSLTVMEQATYYYCPQHYEAWGQVVQQFQDRLNEIGEGF